MKRDPPGGWNCDDSQDASGDGSVPWQSGKAIRKGPAYSGDGTVPEALGTVPGLRGVSRIYKFHGFGHQGAYGHVSVRGATFFAIVDMVKRL